MFNAYKYIDLYARSQGWPKVYRITGLARMEELSDDVRNTQFPCVAVEIGADGNLDLSTGSCLRGYYTFYVLDRVATPSDMESMDSTLERTFAIGQAILTQMRRDMDMGAPAAGFEPEQVSYSRVTTAGMCACGYAFNVMVCRDYE